MVGRDRFLQQIKEGDSRVINPLGLCNHPSSIFLCHIIENVPKWEKLFMSLHLARQ